MLLSYLFIISHTKATSYIHMDKDKQGVWVTGSVKINFLKHSYTKGNVLKVARR